MSPKELKKLADACRKAGIRHYKHGDIEFTLTEDAPRKASSKKQSPPEATPDSDFETDSLTQEQILMWSSAPGGAVFPGEQEEA